MLKVCIIGAGASGLTCIKVANEENLEITCYERSDYIGGLWRYHDDDDPKLASVTRSTIINSSKEMSSFSDFCPPSNFPNYMHNSLMLKYFELYAQKFDLLKFIKFKNEVLEVKKSFNYDENGQWIVKVKDLNTNNISENIFNAVMVCTGHHVKPLIPKFKGQEKFQGKIIHTHSYKTPTMFENDRCLIIGIGNSGGDAAVELSMFAKKVYLSTRRGAWILWRVGPGGMPFDSIYIRRFCFMLMFTFPYWLVNKIAQLYLNLRFNHKNYGIQPDHYVLSQHPMVNDALPNRILSGTVEIRQDIEEIVKNGVIFKDEKYITEVDSIILATGYDTHFPFIDKSIIDGNENEIKLYKYMFNPDLKHPHTLAFIGLIQAFGPAIPISEIQARWHIQLILNKCKSLPKSEIMHADIKLKRKEIDERYFKGARHTMQVDWVTFMDEIASQFGAKPNLLKIFFIDPKFWFTLYFGPCLPYQYRINGPNSWPKAKETIYTYNERVSDALKTRKCVNNFSNNKKNLLNIINIYYYIQKFLRDTFYLNNVFGIILIFILAFGFFSK